MSDQPTVEIRPPAGQPLPPHRRRGRWIAVTAVVAAVAVAAALSLYFGLRTNSAPASSSSAPTGVSPSPTAPSVVLPSASASQSTVVPNPSKPPAPDGRISEADLRNATLDIPPWPTDNITGRSGPVKFTDGQATVLPDAAHSVVRYMTITSVVYGDVNRDGAQETVAVITAGIQGRSEQVLVFTRDPSGRLVTLGAVVATTGTLRNIDDSTLRVNPDGTISVRVGDYQRCCGDETPQQWQTRSYTWNGHGFTQSGGPTSFPVNPAVTETGITAGQLVLGPATGGVRHGTLDVTVTYSYGATPAHLTLDFMPPAGLRPEGSDWPPTYILPHEAAPQFAVDLPTPARGTSKAYTFAFSGPASLTSTNTDFTLALYAAKAANNFLSEANGWNNGWPVAMRTTG